MTNLYAALSGIALGFIAGLGVGMYIAPRVAQRVRDMDEEDHV